MNDKHACFREVIAQGCIASIERCTCDTLHLVLGPFSLKLNPEQFRSLFLTMLEAQSGLERQAEEPQGSVHSLANLLGQRATRGES